MGSETFCDSCGKTNTGKSWWEIHALFHDETAQKPEEMINDISMDVCQNCIVAHKFLNAFKKK